MRRRDVFVGAQEAIGHSLTSSLDLNEVLDTIVGKAREVLGAEAALVVSWDGQAPAFTVMRASGRLSAEYAAAGSIPVGGGPTSRAILESRAVTTPNILTDSLTRLLPERRRQIEREGYKAVAAAPLVSKGRVHGALVVHYWTERTFAEAEIAALKLLADQAALAIDNARLYAEAVGRAARLRDLATVSQSITASLDTTEVMRRIANAAAAMAPGAMAAVDFLDAERRVLRAAAVSGAGWEGLPLERPAHAGLPGLVVEQGAPVLIPDPIAHPRTLVRSWWEARPTATFYGVPIVIHDTFVGVLHYILPDRVPDQEEQEALRLLAAHAGVAIHNASLYEAERTRAEQVRAVAAVNRRISSALELDELLRAIAESAAHLTGARLALFWLADAERRTLALTAGSASEIAADFPQPVVSYDEGMIGWIARERAPLVVDEVSSDDRILHRAWWDRWSLRSFAGYPVLAGDELLAVLVLIHSQPIESPPAARDVIDIFSAQAGVAIQNARLYREARRRRDIAEALARLGRELTATLDVERITEMVARGIVELFGVRGSAVYRYEPADGTLHVVTSFGVDAGAVRGLVLGRGEGVSGRAVAERRVVISRDVLEDPAVRLTPAMRERIRASGYRVALGIPLVTRERVIGAIALGAEPGREFSADELQTLQAFADQVILAVENARLYARSERERREAAALAEAARRLAASLDLDEVAERLVDVLRELFDAHASALYRLREDDGAIVSVALGGPAREHLPQNHVLPRGAGVVARAVEERRPVWSRDVLEDPEVSFPPELRELVARSGNRAVLAVPLIVKGEVVGALAIALATARDFTRHEVALLQAFADQSALALENARLYAAARDSVERLRQTQAQLVQAAKMSALGQLVSGVAHELNNPLSVIIGYGQLLLAREIPPAMQRPVELMVSQADRMAKIVRNLLFFARQRPVERTPVEINEVIEQALALRLSQLRLSGITVEQDLAPELPTIAGDAQQLQQVFLNLLLNAEQAILEAQRRGRIVLRTRLDAGDKVVRAQVIDDGPGIAPDVLPRVFEPFFTTKEVGAGTGLGLSVSYGIVQEHGGRLSVESVPGSTVFTVELALGVVEERRPEPTPPFEALTVDGRLALVVEDEPGVLDLVVTLLGQTGWRVDVASGGKAGLARVRRRRYDVIVSDMRMPEGGGEDFYRVAAAEDPALARRFIFITGDTANPEAWRFLREVNVPVIEKPFQPALFLDVVRRVATSLTASGSGA
ncbi:MAG: GAF domain-containing protein [Candidatus Rokubacteria bacterium]|nr:GAF domain-containing protein [Candidatus Rokubacteria bacterium]